MARKIAVEIVGDARSLERSYDKATRATKGFGREMQGANRHVTRSRSAFSGLSRIAGFAGVAIGTAGLAGAVKAFATEALEAQKVDAQTRAALKSTGGVAGVTAKHVDTLANSILKKTGIDDEAVKVSENLLLTFRDIRNETGKGNKIFDQATQSVADLATAMNKGAVPGADQLQRASIQLGKALNDPVKGITALSRVGIQFTKQQKDQIKTLVDAGDKIGAQKVILAELNKEVGGRAAAAGKTFQGQWAILRETVLNLGGAVAQTLMPAVQRLLTQLVKWLNNSENQKKILDTVHQVIGAVSAAVKVLTGAFKFLNSITGSTKHTLELLFAVLVAYKGLQLAGRLQAIATNIGLVGSEARGARGGVAALRGSFVGKAGLVGAVILAGFELSKLIRKIPGWDKAFKSLGASIADAFGQGDTGPAIPGGTSKSFRFLRRQARRLRQSGLSTAQTAAVLQRRHPGVSGHDIAVASGGIVVHGGIHLHGVQNVKQLENELAHRRKGRAHQRKSRR